MGFLPTFFDYLILENNKSSLIQDEFFLEIFVEHLSVEDAFSVEDRN
jgi:hypothetical protein